ncbi:SDR family oxidoreductase [Pseudoalteromonas arctica]|uniref:NAD-dependent epimerase/dehydratase family protein n=1 Tax=Pseudoalteromonas arctica TaxID=394751 RepID=UPI001C9C4ED6|nr:SDR family oxidoreductase [Pseudoalteromonas arctica]MBZ2191379.1 SDR family oxidoreductase [Pseudoalteromonas arctica]
MMYTVIGGKGFIGSEIVKQLSEAGEHVYVPEKLDKGVFSKPLGTVIYAAGHGDCANNSMKVFDSNVNYLVKMLESSLFDRFIYISSTRVYMNQQASSESADLTVCAKDNRALFNLTKLTAENLVLNLVDKAIIVRPSNVYGLAVNSPLFLPSIVRDSIAKKEVNMYIREDYQKDYVSVVDVADAIYKLSKADIQSNEIFNIASGRNTRADTIAKVLTDKTGCEVNWFESNVNEAFSEVDISKLQSVVDFSPTTIEDDLESMINSFTEFYDKHESFTF